MLIVLMGLLACNGAPQTLKIGLVAPFEGLDRAMGYEALFAVKLALQERNAVGGIKGYQIELVALNDFNDPTEAQVQAKALLADPDVLGVVGHLSSATTMAAQPIYQAAGLAVCTPEDITITTTHEQTDLNFAKAYQKLSGFPPTPRAMLVYKATNILLNSIEKAMLINGNGKPSRLAVGSKE